MKPDKKLLRRVYFLIAVLGVWVAAIVVRLCFLQIVESSSYAEEAAHQQQRTLPVPPPRGNILDRNGNLLASTLKASFSAYADPREIVNLGSTAAALALVTGIPADVLAERLAARNSRYVLIQPRLSASERRAIEALNLQGIVFEEVSQRKYPNGGLAAQLVGYVGVDEVGLGGLEYKYDSVLRGEAGKTVVLVDARFKSFHRVEKEPVAGANLTTTIDEHIQSIVEKELRAAAPQVQKTGGIAIVAMDPHNGEILAMASYPTFDPNNVSLSRPEDRINRAVNQIYEPGSTLKIATVLAALEEGLTNKDERIDCQMGSIVLAKHTIHDHKQFGVLTVSEILQYSSDVGAIKLGLRLGDERLATYLNRLGFGNATGIDLPGEVRGILHPASQWSKISIGAVSMGQEVSVTPLQILSMVAAVANGGILYKPYVVSKIERPQDGAVSRVEPSGHRVISEPTVKQLQEMLEYVVTDGTAKASRPEGYRAAGKTGTAQKYDPKTGTYSTTRFVASFAGYAPASNPSLAVIVVVDEPIGAYHGGDVAAPIFKRIVEQVLQYRSVPPDVPGYAPRYAIAPALPGPHVPPPVKDWAVVRETPGEESAGSIQVPNFRDKSMKDAAFDAIKLGIKVRPVGSGWAVDQAPPPGARVNPGASIDVLFEGVP